MLSTVSFHSRSISHLRKNNPFLTVQSKADKQRLFDGKISKKNFLEVHSLLVKTCAS